ncbi:MAG: hypothetical protein SOW14_00155 [Agathobacter sp.]|nr:hypothetical protein [Lachnospiraceae bacterium]MDY2619053.1 hypothetical protein [Agathobacter sp.]
METKKAGKSRLLFTYILPKQNKEGATEFEGTQTEAIAAFLTGRKKRPIT